MTKEIQKIHKRTKMSNSNTNKKKTTTPKHCLRCSNNSAYYWKRTEPEKRNLCEHT